MENSQNLFDKLSPIVKSVAADLGVVDMSDELTNCLISDYPDCENWNEDQIGETVSHLVDQILWSDEPYEEEEGE